MKFTLEPVPNKFLKIKEKIEELKGELLNKDDSKYETEILNVIEDICDIIKKKEELSEELCDNTTSDMEDRLSILEGHGIRLKQLFGILFHQVCKILPELDFKGDPIIFFPNIKKYNVYINNEYCNGPYFKFNIPSEYYSKPGVYLIFVDDVPTYVGECSNLGRRFNEGYGNISENNRFKLDKFVYCKVNNLILEALLKGSDVKLFFYETLNHNEVKNFLLDRLKPEWNKKCSLIPLSKKKIYNKNGTTTKPKNKYYPLKDYLNNSEKNIEILTYQELENILGFKLPVSAYKYRSWWGNTKTSNSQAKSWMEAGWKVNYVELGEYVAFIKTYNNFY